jgi:hypothetical protein
MGSEFLYPVFAFVHRSLEIPSSNSAQSPAMQIEGFLDFPESF